MDPTSQPRPHEDGELLEEMLRMERHAVLDLAKQRRESARHLDGRAIGVAHEKYIVTDDSDIPLVSEKIRIEKREDNRVVQESYLYLPFDFDFRDRGGEEAGPAIIFFSTHLEDQEPKRVIVSKDKTSLFGPNDEMYMEMEDLMTRSEGLDIGMVFPDGATLKGEVEYEILQEIKGILADRNGHRFTAQERPYAS